MIRQQGSGEDVKAYLVEGSRDVAILDTGLGIGDFAAVVASLTSCRPRVFQTHVHWDHVGASHQFADAFAHPAEIADRRPGWPWEPDFQAPPGMADAVELVSGLSMKRSFAPLAHGDRVDLGNRTLEVLHTPGHSRGSVCYLDREARALFTGDLLYFGAMLVFVPGSDPAAFHDSLHLVASLASDVDHFYPAHGPSPLRKEDVTAIRDAFETVWSSRAADHRGSSHGYPVAIHEFGRFSFLLPPGDWRPAASG